MNAKRFFATVLAAVLLILGAAAAFVAWVDPLHTNRKLEEGDTALFVNQRYEMPGLIRNQDYSAVVMGTSLVANFRASWFTEGTGLDTLKITFPDGWIREFDTALNLAYDTHPNLERVYFCLDPNILIRSDSQRTVELPQYLYDRNPFNDVEFYLNADSFVLALQTLRARMSGEGTDLDSAYIWDGTVGFTKVQALASYPRPEESGVTLPVDYYRAACDENLALVESWLTEHPDTEFTIWFPPYSVLYWDKMTREGSAEAVLWAVEYAVERLLEHDNVSVHCFLIDYTTICDLYLYTDHIHCSGVVTKFMADEMLAGRWHFTKENYQLRLDELRQFVANYNYDAIFDGA